ncbi:MAG: hypothetical protein HQL23_05415 [Candidatus Omnitrophica bacterium]|nr:hypothetical protein [Candidatus Omnitrophota bacterium]
MKKTIFALMIMSLLSVGVSGVFAAETAKAKPMSSKEHFDLYKGTIEAIDTVKNEITVKNLAGKTNVFVVTADQISGAKVGELVRLKVKPGTNVVVTLIKSFKKEAPKNHTIK